ncbi:MAG: sialate O-acetylesterase [Defluviitaleaceae bacterium]|nr:sialate O-acetylesterase [Defluviitaleaceae bacterium]MCL2240495.1 sialate O-acetylesterase [Defluviitaleaceae bacterium]
MITLPAFFSNGMVIGKKARIWGKAAPGQEVGVSFLGNACTVVADGVGRFEAVLTSVAYGGPHTLTVGERVITEVYVGRLWLCGGQSNMETPLGRVRPLLGDFIKEDVRIRAFQVGKELNFDGSAEDVDGQWHTATGDFLDDLYAVPYFFARALREALGDDVPVGLLNVAAGGTAVESWLPEGIIAEYPDLYEKLEAVRAPGYLPRVQKEGEAASHAWHEALNSRDLGLREEWHKLPPEDSDAGNHPLLAGTGFTYGAVWFWKRITLHALPEGVVRLDLGRAADSVCVYVNGRRVTSVDYQYPPCGCELPGGLLQEGENLIAIRLVGSGQKPHFVADKTYALTGPPGSGFHVDLSAGWHCRVGAEMPYLAPIPWFYSHPCGVYNHMLAPVLGIAVEGAIWYQGESNVGNPPVYAGLFARFVNMLRKHCGADLPVIFTQLANYLDPNCSNEASEVWAQLREQQRQCLKIPHTAMAVAIDCGEQNDIHPLDKKTVGTRLALHALKRVYGRECVTDGPTATRAQQHGDIVTVYFDHALGLWAKGGRPMVDIVTPDGKVHHVYAAVEGEVLHARVGALTAAKIRFGWLDCPPVVLYNAYNLPASPFEITL